MGARARGIPESECMYEAAPVLHLRRTEEIALKESRWHVSGVRARARRSRFLKRRGLA